MQTKNNVESTNNTLTKTELDKLAKNNIIHKNKAANLKSKLTKQVATL